MKTLTRISASLLLMIFSGQLMAQIEVSAIAEIEVTEVNAQGEKVVKRTAASSVVPGTEVIYTITARNSGTVPADHIVVTNPVPEETVYVDGSASGSGTDIAFSVDGGNSYDKAEKLTIEDADGNLRAARAEDYTHVRWTLQSNLGPDQEAPVWYRARVK
ncbi:MAG: hypothetical protein WBO37_02785 [Gammaproteobacteria bacterium]